MKKFSADEIDAILPQTQCGLCDYSGCRPYAEAIVQHNERIDRCPPGGVKTLKKLAEITHQDPTPFIPEMEKKEKPPQRASIREAECIGCTKCIKVCPTDAIIGASKQMHTVIEADCTGCELCVPACPVDCIDLITLKKRSDAETLDCATRWRTLYQKHNQRLARKKTENTLVVESLEKRQSAIADILHRVRKKNEPPKTR